MKTRRIRRQVHDRNAMLAKTSTETSISISFSVSISASISISTLYKPVHPGECDSCCLLYPLEAKEWPTQLCPVNPLQS